MAYIIYPNIEAITNDMFINSDTCADYFRTRKNMDEIINSLSYSKMLDINSDYNGIELPKLFLQWAKDIFFHEKFTESLINYVIDEDSFEEINLKVCNSFRAFTEKSSNYILDIYYARIIINLLFREIVLLDYLPDEERKKIIGYLHIPIDKSVIMAIRPILNRKEYKHNLGTVPEYTDTDYIDSYIKYYTIQKFFNDIALKTDVPRIYYYNLIKYKENISGKTDTLSESSASIYQNDIEEQDKVYTIEEFLNSKVFNKYSNNVCEILENLLGKISDSNLNVVILDRKKFLIISDKNDLCKKIVRVWINNRSVHIEIEGQDIKRYSSPSEISESLIKRIEEKFSLI